jgi:hypothetical protein
VAGSINLGGGGGGGGGTTGAASSGSSGGSGVIVLRFAAGLNIRIGAGLSYTTSTISGDTLITITAGTDTVTFF